MKTMSDEEINRKIAEFDGWEPHHSGNWKAPFGRLCVAPPSYTEDLNAVHEARQKLPTPEKKVEFMKTLCDIVKPASDLRGAAGFWHVDFQLLDAPAAAQCEALLRTLNLWPH